MFGYNNCWLLGLLFSRCRLAPRQIVHLLCRIGGYVALALLPEELLTEPIVLKLLDLEFFLEKTDFLLELVFLLLENICVVAQLRKGVGKL